MGRNENINSKISELKVFVSAKLNTPNKILHKTIMVILWRGVFSRKAYFKAPALRITQHIIRYDNYNTHMFMSTI